MIKIVALTVTLSFVILAILIKRRRKKECEENFTLKNLMKIDSLSSPKIDPLELLYVDQSYYNNKIKFEHRQKSIVKDIPLKSLKYLGEDRYGYHRWTVDQDEYHHVYRENKLASFVKINNLSRCLSLLEENMDKVSYRSILNKYEIPSVTIINALEECVNIHGYVTNEIGDKITKILKNLVIDVLEIQQSETNLKREMDEAAIKSFSTLLDIEIEVLNNHRQSQEF